MEEFLDTRLVECNRAQATRKSEENKADWTNTLNETIQLQAGDKVSVHASYIAESGADATQSVEFTGEPTGKIHTIKYTKIDEIKYYVPNNLSDDYPITQRATTITEDVPILDNEATIVINYFKTMDGYSYNQLPRRFMPVPTNGNWSIHDSVANGRPHREPYATGTLLGLGRGYVIDDYKFVYSDDNTAHPTPVIEKWILKNDNTRFTIMIRDETLLSPTGPILPQDLATRYNGAKQYYPRYYKRDMEQFNYMIYREKIKISLDKGFASSYFVANEITRQLRNVELEDPKEYRTTTYHRKVNSSTYKTFAAGCTTFNKSDNYDVVLNNQGTGAGDPGTNGPIGLVQSGTGAWDVSDGNDNDAGVRNYYRSFQFIGVKRPEIYEAGCALNPIEGFHIAGAVDGTELFDEQYFKDGGLITNLEYNKTNLALLRDFINSQAKYPELFSQKNIANLMPVLTNIYGRAPVDPILPADDSWGYYDAFEPFINENNARFFHMNPQPNLKTSYLLYDDVINSPQIRESLSQLGCSYYDFIGTNDDSGIPAFNRALDEDVASKPFFFHYDPTQKDKYYDNPDGRIPTSNPKLTYGCFGRSVDATDPLKNNNIVIYPNLIVDQAGNPVGIPSHFFTEGTNQIPSMRKLGFDRHFNAWSTCAIHLQSGVPEKGGAYNTGAGKYPDEFDRGFANETGAAPPTASNVLSYPNRQVDIINFNSLIYLGADAAELEFDGNHFAFKNLHTPLARGDLENNDVLGGTGVPSLACYKMNPREDYSNYNTTRLPYNDGIPFKYAIDPGSAADRIWIRLNRNLTPFAIYDTTTGIFIEDLGYDTDNWEDGLWNKLGFDYKQYNSGVEKSDRLTFVDSSVKDVNILTTNVELTSADTKGWSQNQYLNPKFNGDLCGIGTIYLTHTTGGGGSTRMADLLPVVIQTGVDSVKRTANNYPVALNQGFYAVRSDIVPQHSYSGAKQGNTALPIVAVISKQNPASDYFFAGQSTIEHIITKPTTLSSINVAITDPDGSFSNISKNSAVIFRIDRRARIDTQVAREVFERAFGKRRKNKM